MDEHEKSLLEEARSCDDCLPWLKHCKAECCQAFTFRLDTPLDDVDRDRSDLRIHARLTPDLRYYIELHDAKVEDDTVVIPMDRCTFSQGLVHVAMRCTALQEDYLCSLHPDRKPEACVDLTLEAAREDSYWTPPTCLFSYKMRADGIDGESDG